MAPIYVLDPFYLAITLLITVGYQLLGFFIAWTLQFDKITDFTGGMSVALIPSIYRLSSAQTGSNFFILGGTCG